MHILSGSRQNLGGSQGDSVPLRLIQALAKLVTRCAYGEREQKGTVTVVITLRPNCDIQVVVRELLVSVDNPDKICFVSEALVGNEAVQI
jgi:hypothetical protein